MSLESIVDSQIIALSCTLNIKCHLFKFSLPGSHVCHSILHDVTRTFNVMVTRSHLKVFDFYHTIHVLVLANILASGSTYMTPLSNITSSVNRHFICSVKHYFPVNDIGVCHSASCPITLCCTSCLMFMCHKHMYTPLFPWSYITCYSQWSILQWHYIGQIRS